MGWRWRWDSSTVLNELKLLAYFNKEGNKGEKKTKKKKSMDSSETLNIEQRVIQEKYF